MIVFSGVRSCLLKFAPNLDKVNLFQLLAEPTSSVSVKLLIFSVLGRVSCFSASDKAAKLVGTTESQPAASKATRFRCLVEAEAAVVEEWGGVCCEGKEIDVRGRCSIAGEPNVNTLDKSRDFADGRNTPR